MEIYVPDQEFEDHIDFVREQQNIGKYWNVRVLSYSNDL